MDILLASVVFAIVFIPTIVYLTNSVGAAEVNRLALRRMSPDVEADLGLSRRRRPDSGWLGRWLADINLIDRLEENMWQAGLYLGLTQMLVFLVILFGVGVATFAFLWQDPFYSLAGGVGMAALPIVYIRIVRKRRLKAFAKQLPFALDLIKSSLQAGHTLQRAIQVLVAEFSDPLGTEFRTVLEQNRIGLPLGRAFQELLDRVPLDDLRLLVVAIKVQSEVGSSLAEIAGRLSELVRAREKLRLQINAMTAQARFGGMLVAGLPIIVLSAFSLMDPHYTRMLFHDPAGFKILKIALAMDATAGLWIRRLLNVRY